MGEELHSKATIDKIDDLVSKIEVLQIKYKKLFKLFLQDLLPLKEVQWIDLQFSFCALLIKNKYIMNDVSLTLLFV